MKSVALLGALLLSVLTGCSPDTDYAFSFDGPESDRPAFDDAIAEWSVCDEVHVTSSSDGVPVRPVTSYPMPRLGLTTFDGSDAKEITYLGGASNIREILAHEIGHAMKLLHTEGGLMREKLSAPEQYVTAVECAALSNR